MKKQAQGARTGDVPSSPELIVNNYLRKLFIYNR
jgi:hypothetical protein